ncbi:MAG: methyl-accepting chemotaxis protein [Deltaproteobacteria bacterium]|nr:methyl-accepting chemotaxis protein [Deltaproteobacteria bacterium]
MKLGTKIILGFVLTNLIYLTLFAIIFVFVRPQQAITASLDRYVLRAMSLADEVRFLVAEQRGTLRDFRASPDNDRRIFDQFLALNKATTECITNMDRLLSEPGAASLRTQELSRIAQLVPALFQEYTTLAMTVPDHQDLLLKARNDFAASYREAGQAVKEALKLEKDTFDSELRAGADQATLGRRVEHIVNLNVVLDNLSASNLALLQAYAMESQELYRQSQSLLDEVERGMSAIIAAARIQAVRAALQKSLDVIRTVYAPNLKTVTELAREEIESTARHYAILENLLTETRAFAVIVFDLAQQYAKGMGEAISKIIFVMLAGSLAALIASLLLAVFMTRNMIQAIEGIMGNLSKSSDEIQKTSQLMTSTSNSLSDGASSTAASLEETSAALEELSSMTRRNADNAVEANGLMAQANQAVTHAQTSMQSVIQAMEEISHSGNEIGKIIKTIDEIAFQTNLLALNAAVEAARAGEAGAGFAVVADEVRNLAIRSAEAAKNTADLIAATIANINSGSGMVNDTAASFETVKDHSAKVANLIAEVSEASREQSQGIGQISTAVADMDKVTQAKAAIADDSAREAGRLSRQAGYLLESVNDILSLVHGDKNGQASARLPAPPPKAASKKRAAPDKKALPMNDGFGSF